LKSHLRIAIETLLKGGATQREIERFTGVDRKTIRRYQRLGADSPGVATGSGGPEAQIPPPRPPAPAGAPALTCTRVTPSACEPHRAFIEAQIALGRNAVSIYQDLVEAHGFRIAGVTSMWNSPSYCSCQQQFFSTRIFRYRSFSFKRSPTSDLTAAGVDRSEIPGSTSSRSTSNSDRANGRFAVWMRIDPCGEMLPSCRYCESELISQAPTAS